MIEVDRLSKHYGPTIAVSDVCFHVPRGEVVAFLGPNGAGKTTTLRVITGYHPPTAGRVEVAGSDVVRQSQEVRSHLGYLPESTPLYSDMRVCEYLEYRGRIFGQTRADRRLARQRVVERCWLADVQNRLIGHLSKGFRQRVGLAATLLHDPPVLILDEPTAGLDPSQILETRRLLRELAGDHTMLLSTHILPEAQRVCDRVIVIARGRIRAQGTPSELMAAHRQTGQCIVECSDPLPAIDALREVGDIDQDTLPDGWTPLTIKPLLADDQRERIASLLLERGILARELRAEAHSLEEIFIKLTSAEGEASPTEHDQEAA